MKVSDRIKELRKDLANSTIDTINRAAIDARLIQLEAEVAEVLQAARQEGYLTGYTGGYKDGVHDAANGR